MEYKFSNSLARGYYQNPEIIADTRVKRFSRTHWAIYIGETLTQTINNHRFEKMKKEGRLIQCTG